ncbi:13643_t:CDS:2, partial [Cetraspora pellucida]
MPKTNKKTTRISAPKTFKYVEPSVEELKAIRESSKVQATHKATQVWVKILEEFRADVGYEGKIEDVSSKAVLEDQLCKFICAIKRRDGKDYHASSIRNCMAAIWRHLNEHSALEKPVDILNPKVFYDLNTIMNGKLKMLSLAGLGERNGADGLLITEVEQILAHPTMQRNYSEGLLRR